MFSLNNYGVVYTPNNLADFVAELLFDEVNNITGNVINEVNILDPACGEGILLHTITKFFKSKSNILPINYGIDVDDNVIKNDRQLSPKANFNFIHQNTILPSSSLSADNYWKRRIKNISCIIANPPWSAEKVFDKSVLNNAGYRFGIGQYDSYVLFLELSLKLLNPDGFLAFIIPDSLFSGENKELRKFLLENTEIKVIARLGEKLFPNVNRSTSVIVIKNTKPSSNSKTSCYRLDTIDRKAFLDGKLKLIDNYHQKSHYVLQHRFLDNANYVFDIDTHEEEEKLVDKIEKSCINWKKIFRFGRGVEISKSGNVVTCPNCQMTQGYTKKHLSSNEKKCQFCGSQISFNSSRPFSIISDIPSPGFTPMYVGENLHRYSINGIKYIKPNVKGINYKNAEQYVPPKILIRKTGLGIDACIDYESTYISQTIYSVNYINNNQVPLEYYLGVLNSRLIYYYYLKKYGENEWKSHPYLTKDIVFSLPIKQVNDENKDIAFQIADKVKMIQSEYTRKLDIDIEKLVFTLYDIDKEEVNIICETLNSLPDLSAINHMKTKDGELDV